MTTAIQHKRRIVGEPQRVKIPPHIAVRTHLSYLGTQQIPEGGTRQFLSATLCAAPYILSDGDQPPLLPPPCPLRPYLPWFWNWLDNPDDRTPGFRWTLFVETTKTGGKNPQWREVPAESVRIYAQPAGWNDDLDIGKSHGRSPTIRSVWWEEELARLSVENQGKSSRSRRAGWRKVGNIYPAHASGVTGIYQDTAPQEIEVEENQHDDHDDILGQRQMRWATENPPYNYFNRLSVVFSLPPAADLRASLKQAGHNVRDNKCRYLALPVWISGQQVEPAKPIYSSPTLHVVVFEQGDVPASGADDGAIVYRRRTYANIAESPTIEKQRNLQELYVEIEPWRVDVEQRLACCIDAPSLLLEWTNSLPLLSERRSRRSRRSRARTDSDLEQLDAFITSRVFAGWIAGLTADIFQGRVFEKSGSNSPRDTPKSGPLVNELSSPQAWLETLLCWADPNNKSFLSGVDQETIDRLKGLTSAILSWLPDRLAEKEKDKDKRKELRDQLQSPLKVASLLRNLPAQTPADIKRKAKSVISQWNNSNLQSQFEKVINKVCAEDLLTDPAEEKVFSILSSGLPLYRSFWSWIYAEDHPLGTQKSLGDPPRPQKLSRNSLQEWNGISQEWSNLLRAGSALERLLGVTATTREERIATLREFIQVLRESKLFVAVLANVEKMAAPMRKKSPRAQPKDEEATESATERDRISEALEWLLQRPFNDDQPLAEKARQTSLAQKIVPSLRLEDVKNKKKQFQFGLTDCVIENVRAYIERRRESTKDSGLPAPQIPSDNAGLEKFALDHFE